MSGNKSSSIYNNQYRYRLCRYLLTGVLIRIIFMPFIYMEGLLYTYRRSAFLLFEPGTILDIEQLIIESFQSAYLFIIDKIFPYFESIKIILLNEEPYTSWYYFSNNEYVFRTLFIFKSLYLIFDIIAAFIITRFYKNRDNKARVFKYWMLSPLIIFIVYMIGRLDIIPVAFLILAFYLAKSGRRDLSYFIFILAAFMRFFPLLVLPFFIGYISRKKRDYFAYGGISISIFAIIELSYRFVFSKSLFMEIISSYHFELLFIRPIGLFPYDKIIIFPLLYVTALVFYFRSKDKDLALFIKYGAIVYLLFFATSVFYPQYFLWVFPFLLFLLIQDKKLIILHIIQFIFFLLLIPFWWKWPYSNKLFAAIDFEFFDRFPNLDEMVQISYPALLFENIFRIVFVLITLSMVYLIMQSIIKKKSLEDETY
jgi:hypothetical protein